MTIVSLTSFLGWCSVINIAILVVSTLMIIVMRDFAVKIHSRLFHVDAEALPALYLQYMGNYKIAVIILNIVPYIVLRIMA